MYSKSNTYFADNKQQTPPAVALKNDTKLCIVFDFNEYMSRYIPVWMRCMLDYKLLCLSICILPKLKVNITTAFEIKDKK